MVQLRIPDDFVLKGAVPVQVYRDGTQITEECTIDGLEITVYGVAADSIIRIEANLEYSLIEGTFESESDTQLMGYTFTSHISAISGDPQISGEGLMETCTSDASIIAHQKHMATMAGYVTDDNGTPISDVEVTVFDDAGALVAMTYTDADGLYCFAIVEVASYVIQVKWNDVIAQESCITKK